MDHWEALSKQRLKAIASRMGVTIGVVTEAADFIKTRLSQYPASMYIRPFAELAPNESAAVVPDVVMHARGESVSVEVLDSHSRLLGIDATYSDLYGSIRKGDSYLSDDDCRHIREHVERVKCILEAIALRKKTLTRVASHIADYQIGFLLHGPSQLRPLRQKDVAKALEVHESTICRAVAGKFCRLPSGETVSFEVFFDSALPVRIMIREIIARSAEPLSDGEITRKLAEQGVEIARRTVAKYREQLRVLPYQLRAA
jgi:RNA polymerase sigma-54 factor